MTTLRYQRLDVFTDHALAGNQLAVVADADPLDAGVMQRNLSASLADGD